MVQYVFAGLVASWVFYGLTPYKRPTPFDRVVQALVYTVVIQLSAQGVAAVADAKELADSLPLVLLLSVLLGFFLAVAANNDWPFRWLARFPPDWRGIRRLWKITSQSAYGNNLSHAFETREEYVVLALRDGRRVYGWPVSWPDHPDEDYFTLTAYEWLSGANDDASAASAANRTIRPEGVILIAAKDVDVIEFVPQQENNP